MLSCSAVIISLMTRRAPARGEVAERLKALPC